MKLCNLKIPAALCLSWMVWWILTPQLQAQDYVPPEYSSPVEPHTETPALTFEKNMVEVPPLIDELPVDASDFRDPFLLIRKNLENPDNVLIPGTTIDGLRFNSYSESKGFIENFYRDSNFSLDNVFSSIHFVNKEGGCLTCHRGIEEISENHQFKCITCHGGSLRGKTVKTAHRGMVPNPSDLEHAPKVCGKCHAEQVERVQRSLMANPRGIIDHTRYAWGFSRMGESHEIETVEEPPTGEQTPPEGEMKNKQETPPGSKTESWSYKATDHPVDDFMNKKCLRCHLQSSAPHRAGDYRGTGCAACHMVYSNDGYSLTRDRAVQGGQKRDRRKHSSRFDYQSATGSLTNRRGYPVLHKFTVAIPSVQCEHCHNNNGVGSEFEGLFAKPARPRFLQKKSRAKQPVLHGREHDFLLPDIHREKGMHCIDCHGIDEVKADAFNHPTQHDAVKIRCETCHGTTTELPKPYQLVESDPLTQALIKSNILNPNLKDRIKAGDVVMADPEGKPMPHIIKIKDEWVLISKLTGQKHTIPLVQKMEDAPDAHQINKHMSKVECSACHARWSAGEYGLQVIRETNLDREKWKDWSFSDPVLQFKLSATLKDSTSLPAGMLDWNSVRHNNGKLEGNWTPGVWLDIVTNSNWSQPVLGINRRGKVSVMKPRYPYFVTDLTVQDTGENENPGRTQVLKTDDNKPGLVWDAYTPHTIRPSARTCESCHQNSLAAGLGDPSRHQVEDGNSFLTEWMESNKFPREFQSRQTLTREGVPLQTAVNGSRFLNLDELNSLQILTDRYRAWFYRDIRRRGLSRLLVRDTFPFDSKHELNEQQFGDPQQDEELIPVETPVPEAPGPESSMMETQEPYSNETDDAATPPFQRGPGIPKLPWETE